MTESCHIESFNMSKMHFTIYIVEDIYWVDKKLIVTYLLKMYKVQTIPV